MNDEGVKSDDWLGGIKWILTKEREEQSRVSIQGGLQASTKTWKSNLDFINKFLAPREPNFDDLINANLWVIKNQQINVQWMIMNA